jgi:hypothetical protein
MPTTNSLITDAEFLLTQEGKFFPESALDAVTVEPWVDKNTRLARAKEALLAVSPSAELDLILAEDGTNLSDYQLDAVTAQPWIDKNTLMQETRTRALTALKEVA